MADNFFYGLEGRNLFKIYVSDMALNGARVGNHIYDQKSASAIYGQFGIIGFVLARSAAKKAAKKRAEQEAKYDALEPGSPPFREGDKSNFSLSSADVLGATVKTKAEGVKGWLSAGSTIELALASGKKRKFLLIEDQNTTFVKNLVGRVVANTQLIA